MFFSFCVVKEITCCSSIAKFVKATIPFMPSWVLAEHEVKVIITLKSLVEILK